MTYQILNWEKLNFMPGMDGGNNRLSAKQNKDVCQALTYFMQAPQRQSLAVKKKIQEFTTSGDFPTSVLDVYANFKQLSTLDAGYELIFKMVDFTKTKRDGFRLNDVQDYLVFLSTKVGEKAKYYQMKGSQATVYFLRYSGGLIWDRTLIDDQEYWTLEDNAITFRNKWFADKSSRHYALIEAVGAGQNITWQAAQPAIATTDQTYNANRDAQTINTAIVSLINNNINKGYSNVGSDGTTCEVVISCPFEIHQRMIEATNLNLQAFSGSASKLKWNITIVPTAQYASTASYYVILPGNKLISGNRQDPIIFTRFDETAYVDRSVMWARWNATIGDTDQVHRCAIA